MAPLRLPSEIEERTMTEDTRCCGSGACIIDSAGRCWCGQQWDGEKMCRAPLSPATVPDPVPATPPPESPPRSKAE
jgi:hypothetical protein